MDGEGEKSGGVSFEGQPAGGDGASGSDAGANVAARPVFQSYRQFVVNCPDDVSPVQAGEQYREYKKLHMKEVSEWVIRRPLVIDQSWIKDRYDPVCMALNHRAALREAKRRSELYLNELSEGNFKTLKLESGADREQVVTMSPDINGALGTTTTALGHGNFFYQHEASKVSGEKPIFREGQLAYLDPLANTLKLENIPSNVGLADVRQLISRVGLEDDVLDVGIVLTNIDNVRKQWEDLGVKPYGRNSKIARLRRDCYVQFVSREAVDRATGVLHQQEVGSVVHAAQTNDFSVLPPAGYSCQPSVCQTTPSFRVKVVERCFGHPDQMYSDMRATQNAIELLDRKAEIFGAAAGMGEEVAAQGANPLFDHVVDDQSTHEEVVAQLDRQLLYLAWVHAVDFYGGTRSAGTAEMLIGPSGSPHITVRPFMSEESGSLDFIQNIQNVATEADEVVKRLKQHGENIQNIVEWAGRPIDDGPGAEHPEIVLRWNAFIEQNIVNHSEERARCAICEKLFRGPDFVSKHLQNRHIDKRDELVRSYRQNLVIKNFLADPLHLIMAMPEESGDGGVLIQREANQHSTALRRGRIGPREHGGANPYRDWDAPSVNPGLKRADFRKELQYDDL